MSGQQRSVQHAWFAVRTLKERWSITVLRQTTAAFAALPAGTVEIVLLLKQRRCIIS